MYWYACSCGSVHPAGDTPHPSDAAAAGAGAVAGTEPALPFGSWGSEPPSPLDLSLISALYEPVAADAPCSRCGASLGRRLRVLPSRTLGTRPLWRVFVHTSCGGWRRHAHVAEVAQADGELLCAAFRTVAAGGRVP